MKTKRYIFRAKRIATAEWVEGYLTFGGFGNDLVEEYRCTLSDGKVLHQEERGDLNEDNWISNRPIPKLV